MEGKGSVMDLFWLATQNATGKKEDAKEKGTRHSKKKRGTMGGTSFHRIALYTKKRPSENVHFVLSIKQNNQKLDNVDEGIIDMKRG